MGDGRKRLGVERGPLPLRLADFAGFGDEPVADGPPDGGDHLDSSAEMAVIEESVIEEPEIIDAEFERRTPLTDLRRGVVNVACQSVGLAATELSDGVSRWLGVGR